VRSKPIAQNANHVNGDRDQQRPARARCAPHEQLAPGAEMRASDHVRSSSLSPNTHFCHFFGIADNCVGNVFARGVFLSFKILQSAAPEPTTIRASHRSAKGEFGARDPNARIAPSTTIKISKCAKARGFPSTGVSPRGASWLWSGPTQSGEGWRKMSSIGLPLWRPDQSKPARHDSARHPRLTY
jgi:hypothetical protein